MKQTSSNPGLFVAREAELVRMHAITEQAMSAGGSVCFVTGEPGSGKSTLLEEFTRQALIEYPDLIFAAGDCNPQTGTVDPYLPFREIMSDLTGAGKAHTDKSDESAGASRFFQAAARLLTEHGPDLIDIFVPGGALVTRIGVQAASRFRSAKQSGSSDAPGKILQGAGDLDQTHLLEQYTNVILALAEKQPMILLLDDLHWADEASINLLFHLSRRLGTAKVLIIGAYRAHEITLGRDGKRHPLEATLNELKRYHGDIWIDLEKLDVDAKRQFVNQVLDEECNVDDDAFRAALLEKTGGHALFTIELVQYFKERNFLRLSEHGKWEVSPDLSWDGLPARVEGVISERTNRLDSAQYELLTAAAIIGESFAAETLAGMLKLDLRDVVRSLSGPLSKTHALIRAEGFERLAGQRMSLYGFKHNLMHKFFYDSVDEIERSFLHEEAALVMESIFEADTGVVAVQLARHFTSAEITDNSIKYLLLAAYQAHAAYAQKEAIAHCDKALGILQNSPAGEFSSQWLDSIRTEIYTLLGKVLERTGEFEAARLNFENAIDITAESNRLSRAGLKREIATCFERQHQHDKALNLLGQAAKLLADNFNPDDAREMREWISIQNQQLWINYWKGNTDEMQKLIDDIGDTVIVRGTAAQKRQYYKAVMGLGNRLSRFAPSVETLQAASNAMAATQESDSLLEQADVTFATGFIYLHAGDHEKGSILITRSLELSRRCGDRTTQARCLAYLTIVERKLANQEKVEKYLSETRAICEALNMREYVAVVLANHSWLAWKTNKLEEAVGLAKEAMVNWQNHSPSYPFKWLALMQLIDIYHGASDIDKTVEYAKILLDGNNAKLIGGVEEALEDAVSSHTRGDSDHAATGISNTLELAKNAGYL